VGLEECGWLGDVHGVIADAFSRLRAISTRADMPARAVLVVRPDRL
jgi:hypothetical protein